MDFEEHVKSELNGIKDLCKENRDNNRTMNTRVSKIEGKISLYSTVFGAIGAAVAVYLKKLFNQ